MLRLLSSRHSEVVSSIEHRLREQGDLEISVTLAGDLVMFRTSGDPEHLRHRVGHALVVELGPVGWHDYFRPVRTPSGV